MTKEDFNIDFNEKPRITGDEGKILKQCEKCGGFKDLSEFKHKTKNIRMNKTCRRCLDMSHMYHMKHLLLARDRIIAEENN